MDNAKYVEGISGSLKDIIKADVNSGNERTQIEYLDWALDNLKRRYQIVNKWSRIKAWTLEESKDVTQIWMEIEPEIIKALDHYLHDFKHKKLTKEIKATTAKASIKAAMHEAGLKHHFTAQTHRAKVSVLITNNRALTIYISYKKLYQQLPGIIESLKVIRHELESLGSLVTINKAYNTFDWE